MRNIEDFFLLNFWKDENHISRVAKTILGYQFNHDSVKFLCGGNQFSNKNYETFKRRLKYLYLQLYTQNEKPIEVITYTGVKELDKTQIFHKVVSIPEIWCEMSCRKNGLIIRNHDLKGHLSFPKVKIKMNEKFGLYNERLLVFNPVQRVILTTYFSGDAKTLDEGVVNCMDEVNVLSLLLRDELVFSSWVVTGIVACSEKSHHTYCQDCNNIVVSYDIFTSLEYFSNFWDSYIDENLYKTILKDQEDSEK